MTCPLRPRSGSSTRSTEPPAAGLAERRFLPPDAGGVTERGRTTGHPQSAVATVTAATGTGAVAEGPAAAAAEGDAGREEGREELRQL